MEQFDYLDMEGFSPLGERPVLCIDLALPGGPPLLPHQAVIVGVDHAGALPPVDPCGYDLLLTEAEGPPAPWIGLADVAAEVVRIEAAVLANPVAASIFARVLRMGENLAVAEALALESLAYSTLLGGQEFAQWRATRQGEVRPHQPPTDPLLVFERDGDHITLRLNDPDHRNAMTAAMRDALYAALVNILDDPTRPTVSLRGNGKCFSTGGHIPEFGSARDLAMAHVVRTQHSCARAIAALGERIDVHFHGACVGSGLEVPAGAGRRTATANAHFQLPELGMGLIPGAGGTVTVSRAIGRHRTAWMVLTGKRVSARQALEWGLVQHIADLP